jgi:spore maturation protein CgeB
MPLGYAEAVHRPIVPRDLNARRLFSSDVAFLGGWEPRREELLNAIARRGKYNLKIWGYAWDHLVDGRWSPRRALRLRLLAGKESFKIAKNENLACSIQGGEVYADAYAWAVSGARINVGFLRTVCPDQHTTRTFEIPACASMMLADRTDEHREFFEEGKEAEFFSCEEELMEKVRFYLNHEASRERIAYNGYQRCLSSGYSYRERLVDVLSSLN